MDGLEPPLSDDAFADGMAMRRRIHGASHVDRAWAKAQGDPLALAFQQMVTESAWGRVWTRPELPTPTRSLLVIGTLTVLGATHELETHIRSAVLRNDCSMAQVKEAIIQVAFYGGIPRAVDAFGVADRIAREIEAGG